ncbi:MAG: ATP-binding protein [Acidimicrobiia bacterium]|nr:ATP-binding protein [Acidimicrobiia bacterium]MDX2467297.1 ATP-binding protein [Acidimicrobiia bacterium]
MTAAVRATHGWAILSVGDNGAGVPDDRLDVIFSAFGRAHRRTGQTDSVGHGLTVGRQLARMMGGDVTYHRKPNWTSFELRVPTSNADLGDASECFPPPDLQSSDQRELAAHAIV